MITLKVYYGPGSGGKFLGADTIRVEYQGGGTTTLNGKDVVMSPTMQGSSSGPVPGHLPPPNTDEPFEVRSEVKIHDSETPPPVVEYVVTLHRPPGGGPVKRQGGAGENQGGGGGGGMYFGGEGGAGNSGCGMATYSANLLLASLRLDDRPLSYMPAFGPGTGVAVSYEYLRENHKIYSELTNLGPCWRLECASFLVIPAGNVGSYIIRGDGSGGEPVYTYFGASTGSFRREARSYDQIVEGVNGVFERHLPDGSMEVYGPAYEAPSGTVYPLTQRKDPFGNTVHYGWYNGRLIEITDATGKTTWINYLPEHPHRVWKITDPFGRTAVFEYNAAGELSRITDPVGVVSEFGYDAAPVGHFINSLTTPYGTSTFAWGWTDNSRWLEMTDPEGGKERVEFRSSDDHDVQAAALPAVNSLADSFTVTNEPRTERQIVHIPVDGVLTPVEIIVVKLPVQQDGTIDPLDLVYRDIIKDNWPGIEITQAGAMFAGIHLLEKTRSYSWNKRAMHTYDGGDPARYLRAHRTSWVTGAYGQPVSIAAVTKAPLKGEVRYLYSTEGARSLPIKVSRTLENGSAQEWQYAYNELGGPLVITDPLGRETTFDYEGEDPRKLTRVRQTTGNISENVAFYQNFIFFQPQSLSGPDGSATQVMYNARGQITYVINPKGESTWRTYDENPWSPAYGKLKTITEATGSQLARVTTCNYDNFGRLKSVVSPDGYTLQYAYDAVDNDPLKSLDRMTRVTYPDGTFERIVYEHLDPKDVFDRLGRRTRIERNGLRQVTSVTDPAGRTVQLNRMACCGALDELIDGEGNKTEWLYDLQNRVTDKKINNQVVASYTYEPSTGRLKTITDALGQVKTYAYYSDNQLASVTYTGEVKPTADVSYTYDPVYGRLETITDGTGTTQLTYYPGDSQGSASTGALSLWQVDGPLQDDTITYGYDLLGRVTSSKVNGAANETSVIFDELGRLTSVTNLLGTFEYTYQGTSDLTDIVTYPNGQKVDFDYYPNAQDQRLKTITNFGVPAAPNQAGPVLSKFLYGKGTSNGYDAAGRILNWTQWRSNPANINQLQPAQRYDFTYDNSDQLTRSELKWDSNGTQIQTSVYRYDDAGNRVGVQEMDLSPENPIVSVSTAAVNGFNQLTSITSGGTMEVTGLVSTESTLKINNVNVPLFEAGQSNRFTVNLPVQVGVNTFPVTATEQSPSSGFVPQVTNRTLSVNVTSIPSRVPLYDANGNMTNDGAGRTYEWDAENRLVGINYAGGARSEFTYDGASRRVRIVEKQGMTIISDKRFVWNGMNIVEERNGAGTTINKRFYGVGALEGSNVATAAKVFYTMDHLGSVREKVSATGTILSRHDYDPYGRRTRLWGAVAQEPEFGFTGHYVHAKSGLHLAPYRAYSADLGRWISRDPIEEKGGLNLYGYVGNDPLNWIDPLGLDAAVINYGNGTGHTAIAVNNPKGGVKVYHKYAHKHVYGGGIGSLQGLFWDKGAIWDQEFKSFNDYIKFVKDTTGKNARFVAYAYGDSANDAALIESLDNKVMRNDESYSYLGELDCHLFSFENYESYIGKKIESPIIYPLDTRIDYAPKLPRK